MYGVQNYFLNSDFELKDNGHFKISQFTLILDFEYNNLS